jgi:hypothetical protein
MLARDFGEAVVKTEFHGRKRGAVGAELLVEATGIYYWIDCSIPSTPIYS